MYKCTTALYICFFQVKVRRSFPLTSVESVQAVPGNPAMFQLVFHSFIMELEAPNPFETKAWLDALKECKFKCIHVHEINRHMYVATHSDILASQR